MKSIWQQNTELPEFPELTKDIKTDVLKKRKYAAASHKILPLKLLSSTA